MKHDLNHEEILIRTNRKRNILRELIIYSTLNNHENIITMLGYEPNMMILVIEYIKIDDLYHLTIPLSDGRVTKRTLIGTLNGLRGDIKPHNVLVTEDFIDTYTDIYSLSILTNEIIQEEEVPCYEMLRRFYSNGELGDDYTMQRNRSVMNNVKVCAELSNLICS